MSLEIVGYIAGLLTTASFIPQAYKIIRSKNVAGVSLVMYLVFSTGVLCWLIYGLIINNMPMTIFNVITLVLSLLIVFNLIKYRKK